FKTMWADFKNWAFSAFAQIAAKQVVVSLAGTIGLGGVAQNATGSPLESILTGGKGVGGLGSLFSGAGPLSMLGELFGGAGGAALGAGFSAGVETLGIALTAGTEAIGGMSAALGALGAVAGTAIPVLGAA